MGMGLGARYFRVRRIGWSLALWSFGAGVVLALVRATGWFIGWAYSFTPTPSWMAWKMGVIIVGGLVLIFGASALSAVGIMRVIIPVLKFCRTSGLLPIILLGATAGVMLGVPARTARAFTAHMPPSFLRARQVGAVGAGHDSSRHQPVHRLHRAHRMSGGKLQRPGPRSRPLHHGTRD